MEAGMADHDLAGVEVTCLFAQVELHLGVPGVGVE